LTIAVASLEDEIFTFYVTESGQFITKRLDAADNAGRGTRVQKTDSIKLASILCICCSAKRKQHSARRKEGK